MTKVIMVCLGNICRSPMAEGILMHKTQGKDVTVESAGTSDYHIGSLPYKRSIEVAKKNGLDITDQRGRQFKTSDFDTYDYIYAMDNSNYNNIIALARNEADKDKVHLILNSIFPGENVDVPDPYYGGDQGFDHVYNMLDEACEVIAKKLT